MIMGEWVLITALPCPAVSCLLEVSCPYHPNLHHMLHFFKGEASNDDTHN